MNYILSSIILLIVISLIIYVLSINNNIDKLKNKIKELFKVAKSNKINYLNEIDNKNLLIFIKNYFKTFDNIIIPDKIFYNKINNEFIMDNIKIICYKYNNNKFLESIYNITIKFIPFEKEHYISNQTLFNLHGNYIIINNTPDNIDIFQQKISINNTDLINTETLDMIPDVIHLSESEINTPDTEMLISHNFK